VCVAQGGAQGGADESCRNLQNLRSDLSRAHFSSMWLVGWAVGNVTHEGRAHKY